MNKIKFYLRKLTEYPLVKIEDKILKVENKNLIPNNVYQTWESRYLGKTHAKSILEFRDKNPTFSFYIFDKEKRDQYISSNWKNRLISKIYFNSLFGPMKADIFRYCILYDYGGYYFDIGKACSTPLENLHKSDDTGIITYEGNELFYPPGDEILFNLKRPFNYFLQWGLAFSPNHAFLNELIKEIEKNYYLYKAKIFPNPKLAILNFTGPGIYTKVMRNYITREGLNKFSELDVNFNNYGIFKVNGASVRHYTVPSYTYIENSKICN